jgi:hypothetical protein
MRRYTWHQWIVWNGLGWHGCVNWTRHVRHV